jgi:hypothetical protein
MRGQKDHRICWFAYICDERDLACRVDQRQEGARSIEQWQKRASGQIGLGGVREY